MNNIQFHQHLLNRSYLEDIGAVLESRFITSGNIGKTVENQLQKFFSVEHAFLSNSWTNGALACLLAMNIKPGDEIIVPAMTFIATANIAELLGAKPVFVDVNDKTLLMDVSAIESAITAKTRCVIPVHLYGQMCDVASIRRLLDRYPGIYLMEDAAHCFEGTRDNYRPGAHSDCAVFSFYATKNITCGEGGAIISNNSELSKNIAKTRLHGMSAGAIDRFNREGFSHWDMDILGVKANLPDILAALLPRQISSVFDCLEERCRVAKLYRSLLPQISKDISLQSIDFGVQSAEHLMPIHLPGNRRDKLIAHLNASNIGVAVNYRSVPLRKYYAEKYGYKESDHPVSAKWGEGVLSLPMYPGLKDEEVIYVIDVIRDFFNKELL